MRFAMSLFVLNVPYVQMCASDTGDSASLYEGAHCIDNLSPLSEILKRLVIVVSI
jgi:hypothetical protein